MPGATHTPVLIAGAGPVGSMFAVELARYGVPFRLVDKAAGPTDQSRALALQVRALELLHRLGTPRDNVGLAITKEARTMRGFKVHAAAGGMLAEPDLTLDHAVSRYPGVLILPQGRTQRLLLERLGTYGGTAEFGTELVELETHAAAPHGLLRRHDGSEERISADWVIGADGATSFVRRIAGDNFIGNEYPEKFLLADMRLRWPLGDDCGHMFLRAEGPLFAFPLPEPRHWRLIDTSNEAETGEQDPTMERFRQLFDGLVPGMTIEQAGWTALFTIHRRLAERYRAGRVMVMGDAAHIHSPASGQGLNTGLQDAANLAWKLALVIQQRAPHSLLDSYVQERRPVAESVLKGTNVLTKVVLAHNPAVQKIRDWLVSAGLGLTSVQHNLALNQSEIQISYRGSQIVSEWGRGFGHAPKPGDRMPDPELAPGERLSDRLSGDPLAHHLLAFGANDALLAGLRDAVKSRSLGGLVMIHSADELGATAAKAFGANGRGPLLALIRPDLYVGFRAVGSNGLAEAFGKALDRLFAAPSGKPEAHRPGPGVEGYGTAD